MATEDTGCKCQQIENNTDILIAIGAATAANCIPCFEHLYEKAVTSGIHLSEIRRASMIASQVKNGAHIALKSSIEELIGPAEPQATSNTSCC